MLSQAGLLAISLSAESLDYVLKQKGLLGWNWQYHRRDVGENKCYPNCHEDSNCPTPTSPPTQIKTQFDPQPKPILTKFGWGDLLCLVSSSIISFTPKLYVCNHNSCFQLLMMPQERMCMCQLRTKTSLWAISFRKWWALLQANLFVTSVYFF